MRPTNLILASLFAASTIGFTAMAQPAAPKEGDKPKAPEARPGRGGGAAQQGGRSRLSPEKLKAAQEAEATAVAKRNKLSDDQTKALVKAYGEARESYQAAIQKKRDELAANGAGRGAGGEMMAAMEEINKSEKAKFEKALTDASFKSDVTAKVLPSLGTFNPTWDAITDTIIGFKLDEAKQQTAMEAVEDFVVGQSKIMARRGGADVDQEAIKTAGTDNRKKMTESLSKVLSEEQLKGVEAVLARGGGRMGGGAGPAPAGEKKPEGDKKPEGGK